MGAHRNAPNGLVAAQCSEALVRDVFGVVEDDAHEIKTANRKHNGIVLKARQLLLSEHKVFWLCFYDTGQYDHRITRGERKGKTTRENRRSIRAAFTDGGGVCVEADGSEWTARPVVVVAVPGRALIQAVATYQCPLRVIYKDGETGHSSYPHYHLPSKALAEFVTPRTLHRTADEVVGRVRWVLHKHPDLRPEQLIPGQPVQAPAFDAEEETSDIPF